jgi:aminoglycoside phosphotransferase family enzyme/predicted kinase
VRAIGVAVAGGDVKTPLEDLIEALSNPQVYPHKPESVEVVQTHISVVFIAGSLVYKVKKPVDLGFLDFTTLEKRRHFCRHEVILNSRFSEGVYLGVESIFRDNSGINLRGEGAEIEVAVLMRHIPDRRTLKWMLENDCVSEDMLDRVADRIAAIHAQAKTSPDIASFGTPEVIYFNLRENFVQTEPYIGRTIDGDTHEAISTRALDFLEIHEDLFRERMKRGLIRDCHGDLHADHVVLLNGVILVDCIEFNDRFRYGDTASDLGFLLMDFDFHGYPAFAKRVAGRYAETSGDPQILKLLGFYKSYRAFVRGKVLGFTLDEAEVSQREKQAAAHTARLYFLLSLSYLKPPPPVLIITTGFSGTGKSYLSERLGRRLGLQPVRSDVVRKKIFGLAPDKHRLDKLGEGIYTRSASELAYRSLFDQARRSLEQGQSVILDATFLSFQDRQTARETARISGARFRIIECVAGDEDLRQRLERRSNDVDEPSDAGWDVLLHQKSHFDPIRREELADCWTWDSTSNVSSFLASFVREQLAT